MTRRRLLLLVTAACLLAVTFAVRWATTPAIVPGVTRENFDRLRTGMSVEQVEAIIGSPPTYPTPRGKHHGVAWQDGERWIGVEYSGKIWWSDQADVIEHAPESFLAKIRRWLRR